MSHFYISVNNVRGTYTHTGTKKGLTAHIRGWNIGVKVNLKYNKETKKDYIEIYQTGGSNGIEQDKLIKVLKEK